MSYQDLAHAIFDQGYRRTVYVSQNNGQRANGIGFNPDASRDMVQFLPTFQSRYGIDGHGSNFKGETVGERFSFDGLRDFVAAGNVPGFNPPDWYPDGTDREDACVVSRNGQTAWWDDAVVPWSLAQNPAPPSPPVTPPSPPAPPVTPPVVQPPVVDPAPPPAPPPAPVFTPVTVPPAITAAAQALVANYKPSSRMGAKAKAVASFIASLPQLYSKS